MPLIVIYNPVSGDGMAKAFFNDQLLPLLRKQGKNIDEILKTELNDNTAVILRSYLKLHGNLSVVLGSGDGTLHEIINSLSTEYQEGLIGIPRISIALVPCGTANALYSSLFPPSPASGTTQRDTYKLQSVLAFLNDSSAIPLSLATADLVSPFLSTTTTVASVVISTSLHASILHDSESLRREYPGIDRFKIAAHKNSINWYNSQVKLIPSPAKGVVEIYDPSSNSFVTHPKSTQIDSDVYLDGPFVYFLSTVNVDRLEPEFLITPLAKKIPSSDATCEIVILRPLRDPSTTSDSQEARKAFVNKLWSVLGAAYNQGSHVNLRYNSEGEIVSEDGVCTVIEYFRCGGWEWIPDERDENAHLLCADGAISHIPKKGRARCSVTMPSEKTGFAVFI